jgi:hypothetical protein
MTVGGQGVIGRDCAWCGQPVVGEVEVQPAHYRMVSRVDPVSGERTTHRRLVSAAIVVPACDEHQQITTGQPGPVRTPRDGRARDVEQLGLFVTDEDARLRNAIYREVKR